MPGFRIIRTQYKQAITLPENSVLSSIPEFGIKTTSFELKKDYAIITKAVNPLNSKNTVVICAGTNSQGTEAACRIISNLDDINRLKLKIEERLSTIPKWFQVIIAVNIVNGQVSSDWTFIDVKQIDKDVSNKGPEI